MSYSFEYKTVERDSFTTVTKQAKQVFENWDRVPFDELSSILQNPGLEYFTVRRVKDKPARPERSVKKEAAK